MYYLYCILIYMHYMFQEKEAEGEDERTERRVGEGEEERVR